MSRVVVEHNGARRHFDTEYLVSNFATTFNRARKIKQELITAEAVFKALNE